MINVEKIEEDESELEQGYCFGEYDPEFDGCVNVCLMSKECRVQSGYPEVAGQSEDSDTVQKSSENEIKVSVKKPRKPRKKTIKKTSSPKKIKGK